MTPFPIDTGSKILVRTGSSKDGFEYRVGTVIDVGPLSMNWAPHGKAKIRGLREKIVMVLRNDADLADIANKIIELELNRDMEIQDARNIFSLQVGATVAAYA